MASRKVLITGGTGFVGTYVGKMIAATHPDIEVISMSRNLPTVDHELNRFKNVHFVRGDCLKKESLPHEIGEADAVIHCIGILLEGFNYKKFINKGPFGLGVQDAMAFFQDRVPYEQSYEAINRDACINVAEFFNNSCGIKEKKGRFVFLSAGQSVPFLQRYLQTKEKAENYLLGQCPHLEPVILKPGLVTSQQERPLTVPLGMAHDAGNCIYKNILGEPGFLKGFFPEKSTPLSQVADFAMKGTLGELPGEKVFWSSSEMNP